MFAVEMALRLMPSLVGDDRRTRIQTGLHHFGTMLREWAAEESLSGPGHTLPNAQRRVLDRRIRHRHGRDQRLRIRMLWIVDDLIQSPSIKLLRNCRQPVGCRCP